MQADRRAAGLLFVLAGICYFFVGSGMSAGDPFDTTFMVLGVSLAVIGVTAFLAPGAQPLILLTPRRSEAGKLRALPDMQREATAAMESALWG